MPFLPPNQQRQSTEGTSIRDSDLLIPWVAVQYHLSLVLTEYVLALVDTGRMSLFSLKCNISLSYIFQLVTCLHIVVSCMQTLFVLSDKLGGVWCEWFRDIHLGSQQSWQADDSGSKSTGLYDGTASVALCICHACLLTVFVSLLSVFSTDVVVTDNVLLLSSDFVTWPEYQCYHN